MTAWLLPITGFVVVTGVSGVTWKLALRSQDWTQLLVWTAIAYGAVSFVLLAFGHGAPRWSPDAPWAVVSGVLPVASLVLMLVAIGNGDVNRVVPVSSVYPLVTALTAVVFLGESVTVSRMIGMLAVVTGAVLVAR